MSNLINNDNIWFIDAHIFNLHINILVKLVFESLVITIKLQKGA